MKFAVVLLLCLTAGSQASFFDDLKNTFSSIGHALTNTAHAVGDQAKVVGQNLLNTAAEQGKQLASQALQSEIPDIILRFVLVTSSFNDLPLHQAFPLIYIYIFFNFTSVFIAADRKNRNDAANDPPPPAYKLRVLHIGYGVH